MKQVILILLAGLFAMPAKAQPVNGTTGLLNIPSAEMQQNGTFFMGANFLPDRMTSEPFDYNTGNYYFNITFLPFLEFNYRMTLMKVMTGKYNQDRSFGIRVRLLKEKSLLPSFVIGGNDIYSTVNPGAGYFNSLYGVITKNIYYRSSKVGLNAGFAGKYSGNSYSKNMKGLFGGVSLSPGFAPSLQLIGEYDTHAFNAGASVLLFRHFFFYGMLYDMHTPTGGLAVFLYL
jgi:hypothetical protein